MSLPEPVQQWLIYLKDKGKSAHTIQAYQRGLTHFVVWYEKAYAAGFTASAVMPRDVRDWKMQQQRVERAAPATVNQRLAAVSRFFGYARTQGLCRENPAADVETIRLGMRQPKGLKAAALRRLLRAAYDDPRDYAMLELLSGTGLRVGELLALRVGDVLLGERSGKVIVRQGKRDSYREVPLTVDVRRALKAYLDSEYPGKAQPDAPLWLTRRGELKHRSSVMRLLKKYAAQAGIEPLSPHTLRHTFATRYLAANPDDLRGLAKLLGHASLDTVMIYTEPDFDDLVERMERVEHHPR